MIADRHVHTAFSADSSEEPENCVRTAVSLKMRDIYITDHEDMDFPKGFVIEDMDEYFRVLLNLKEKYRDVINVRIGLEAGIKNGIGEKLLALRKRYPFEYIIGSVHEVANDDPFYRSRYDMSDEDFYRLFFETTLDAVRNCGGFDTLGHLDYVVRYGYERDVNYSYEKNADIIDEILKEIIDRGIALEINTAGLRKGLSYSHPYPEILRRYRALGGRMLALGSDAHEACSIGYMFDEALGYACGLGFSVKDFI